MANYFNLLAGIITFIGAMALSYGFWEPVMSFIDYFATNSTTLYVLCGVAWITIEFVAIVIMPFIMMVSDDRGN